MLLSKEKILKIIISTGCYYFVHMHVSRVSHKAPKIASSFLNIFTENRHSIESTGLILHRLISGFLLFYSGFICCCSCCCCCCCCCCCSSSSSSSSSSKWTFFLIFLEHQLFYFFIFF